MDAIDRQSGVVTGAAGGIAGGGKTVRGGRVTAHL